MMAARSHLATVVLCLTSALCPAGAASSTDPLENFARKCANGKQSACDKLATIAKTSSFAPMRYRAVEKITDQSLLADIARADSDPGVRQAAIAKLTDQAALAEMAKTAVDPAVRLAVVDKITDQALLAAIEGADSDPGVRRAAFRRLSSQHECSASVEGLTAWRRNERVSVSSHLVFAQDVPSEVQASIQRDILDISVNALRVLGFNAIADDKGESVMAIEAFGTAMGGNYSMAGLGGTLAYTGASWEGAVSLSHSGGCVYRQALTGSHEPSSFIQVRMGDPVPMTHPWDAPFGTAMKEMLAAAMVRLAGDLGGAEGLKRLAIARGYNLDVALAAVHEIADQAALADIAGTAGEPAVRGAAKNKLIARPKTVADQSQFATIAKTDTNLDTRQAAVAKLNDQALLAGVARNSPYVVTREAAVRKLTDQAVLAQIAKTDAEPLVRNAAVWQLTDQAALADIAKTAGTALTRRAAVRKVTDQSLLATIARADSDPGVRQAAVEQITGQVLLADLAMTAGDAAVRMTCVKKLTERATLATIAKTDSDQAVRQEARRRLEELR
jgi:hypothetical protein